jgi:hypothetical protein
MANRSVALSGYAIAQLQTNAQLTAQQTQQVSPDVTLDAFVRSLGLAAAIGEATMPDRTISGLAATLQTYLTLEPLSDGTTSVGLRLYQPELGTSAVTATLSFELSKVTSANGTTPRNFYTVLSDKQLLFSNAFFAAYPAAMQIVAEASSTLAAVSTWTFPFLIQEGSAIAAFETTLAALLTQKAVAPDVTQAYVAAVKALSAETTLLAGASDHAAGDVYALAAALDATTKIAQTLVA